MSKFQIRLEKNNRKDIVVEDYKDIHKDFIVQEHDEKSTFFYEEYAKAFSLVDEKTDYLLTKPSKEDHINNFEYHENERYSDCANYVGKEKENGYELKNNIIVFSGDRGSGKTSAMISFGKYLERFGSGKNFMLLEMIDPSYFRKNESILLNIITIMFKMAKRYNQAKHTHGNTKVHERKISAFNDLLQDFGKVFSGVKRMDSIIPKEDSIEYLNELSDAIDLKKSLTSLIHKFLRLFEDTPKYLVIMIDDLDMNVSVAAAMLEQIRKFLIHENVIILFATNMDQLQFEMKEYYSKYYDKILNPIQPPTSVGVDVEEMATKYLLKLFPPLQRIHIGESANKLIDTDLSIDKEDSNNSIKGNLQKVILNLIWKKTRLIFIPEDNQIHPIIPTNLRALQQFIYLLLDMEEIKDTTTDKIPKNIILFNHEGYKIAQKNFNKFKDYILNVWIPSNVSFEEQKVFDNIPKDISRINKHLIQSINFIASNYKKSIVIKEVSPEHYLNERGEQTDFDRDIYTFVSPNDPKFRNANKISDIFNFPSNNSTGDILLLIDKYKTYFEAANNNNFVEAIKIYYSLLLFETMFFDKTNTISKETKKNPNSILQELIGGTLYFPHYFNIIKSAEYERFKEDAMKLLGYRDKVKNQVDTILGYHLFYSIGVDLNKKGGFNNPFYILYYGKTRPERSYGKHIYNTNHKDAVINKSEEDYKLGLWEGEYCYRFDILSLLVNVLNPFQTLERLYDEKPEVLKNIEPKSYHTNKINNWINYNSIPETEIVLQNSILPIYSIDLMLIYLREQIDAIELDISILYAENDKPLDNMKLMEKGIRKPKFIQSYYDELIKLTVKELRKIELKNNQEDSNQKDFNQQNSGNKSGDDQSDNKDSISSIYQNIFNVGKECFMDF
jgi:hypothetical protein